MVAAGADALRLRRAHEGLDLGDRLLRDEVLGIEDARITGARAVLRTDVISASPSAKPYSAGERLYGLVNDELLWTFDMAAVGEAMTNHLSARLRLAE